MLKQYKGTTAFIKTLTNGIIFPETCKVFVDIKLPKYENIRRIIKECEEKIEITSAGLPKNVIDIINPLKDSKILPEKEQTDVILNVLPNFDDCELAFRLSDDKFLGQHFRNKVYNKGPTLTVISANKGHVFGGFSPIPWTEGTNDNWKSWLDSFLFTLTDNKGRQPEKLKIDKNRRNTALFHSRISYAFGSGHDLSINLIDIKRSESALFTYMMPKSSTIDAAKYLAGKRENWDVDELEVFLIQNPIKESRYENLKTSLHFMAKAQLAKEGIVIEEENEPEESVQHDATVIDTNDEVSIKGEEPFMLQEELEEKDSILDHSFLYKNLVKDVHLMNREEYAEFTRKKHQDKKKSFFAREL